MRCLLAALLLLASLGLLAATPASAHKPSDSYLTLTVLEDRVDGRWDIALRDLDHAIGLDRDQDGRLTWGEVRARHEDIAAYALAHLSLDTDGTACALEPQSQLVERHSDGAYTVLRFAARCGDAIDQLTIGYRLFFDLDPLHRGLARINHRGQVTSSIFRPEKREVHWRSGKPSRLSAFVDYVRQGVWHIWIGFDHILFLVILLLPAVVRRTANGWQPVPNFRGAIVPVVKIVTAFTLAHSITLSAATLGLVELPSRLVESLIAASIVIAALNNVWPMVTKKLWLVAFAFGLVHGFGFAGVLADLGLPQGALVTALLGFNLGVEVGQLAIVAAVLPPMFFARSLWLYPRVALPLGSAAIALIGGVWLMERAMNLDVSLGILF